MVDLTSSRNFFSAHASQSRAHALTHAARLLDQLALAGRRLDAALNDGLTAAGLSPAEGRALRTIAAIPDLTVGDLTARLGVTKQSLAPVLKTLTGNGYVRATEMATDRRRRQLRLTDAGRAVWARAANGAMFLLSEAAADAGAAASEGFGEMVDRLASGDEWP